ncbi:ParB/RepB/Spo0J family partition protein [Aureliella helgolandensis]|uniref:Chromosome-partitioning protein ParB n=1 Tax=Aureliella helgolandensis TaxID=2527968 RepID=A0A518GBU4_9BACT|nr:ParB/RepB/Spo0J family partition protein [Aureliella helgolandensis]QDV26065.1 Chromosome-partitioning protein ParB [Aureliella helgolandensis]
MTSTKRKIEDLTSHLDESMGKRNEGLPLGLVPQFSPVPSPKDIGRQSVRGFGEVLLEQVVVDPTQPRTVFEPAEIERLAQSIRDKGQLQPIRVRWDSQLEKWAIIAGERRFRATQAAGLKSIQCYFHEGEISESEILEQQMIENLLREDLRPMEEANAYATLMKLNTWNGKQVASALRVSPSRVSRGLALLDLPQEMQQQIESGELPKSVAYELSKLPNEQQQWAAYAQKESQPLSVNNTRRKVKQRQGKAPIPRGVKQTFLTEGEWTVTVASKRKGNYHEIEEALLEALQEVRLRIDNNVHLG